MPFLHLIKAARMAHAPYAQIIFGEIHGMIEAAVNKLAGEATLEEILGATSISRVDAHHALADMQRTGLCDLSDGSVRLVSPSPLVQEIVHTVWKPEPKRLPSRRSANLKRKRSKRTQKIKL